MARLQPLCRFIEDLIIIEGETTYEEVHTKDPLPSERNITKQSDSEKSKHISIQSPHFENILGPANQAEMTQEEQNAAIWVEFLNDEYLPQ